MESQIIKNEIQLQAACAIWFQNNMREQRGLFRRVKNETGLKGDYGRRIGAENRTTGIVAGTWDSFFMCEPIVWIEFKFGNGSLSPVQRDFAEIGKKIGWRFHVIRTLEDFITISKIYFNG